MATQDDVRRFALALPGTAEATDRFAFSVQVASKKERAFAWIWLERITAKRPRVPNPGVTVLRVSNEAEKHHLIGSNPKAMFTEPHYDGYAAVLVRLDEIGLDELEELVTDAWRSVAPKMMTDEFDRRSDG